MYPQRLSNLSQTDLAPLLPLPILPELTSAASASGDASAQLDRQPAVLQQVLALLQSADTSYLVPIQRSTSPPDSSAPLSDLQQAILKLDPRAFDTSTTEQARHPVVPSETFSSSVLQPISASVTNASDSASQPTVSQHERQLSRKKSRLGIHPQSCAPDVDLVAVFNGEMHGFLSKQKSNLDRERGEHHQEDEAGDGSSEDDDSEALTAQTSFHDIRKLNSNLLQLTVARQLHLVQQDKLLCLLDALDTALQQGETLLIGHFEQDDMDQQDKVLLSLEACMACLQILAAPNMPKQMYKEELIDKLVGFVRFQLLHNVLVFYDAALCQASRPELLRADDSDCEGQRQPSSKKKTPKSAKKVSMRVPSSVKAIQARLEALLQVMAQLLTVVQLQHSTLLTLSRVCCQTLTVDGVELLQIKAAGVVVVMFQQCPPLQSTLLEEVLTQVLPCLPVGKRCPRDYVIGDTKSASIQTVVAMLVQMIQGCVQLPESPADNDDSAAAADLRDCFAPAVAHSDTFWHGCLDRFPTAKAHKADSDLDVKQLAEQIILDLLSIQSLPAWPAAATLLIRCINALGGPKGLQHSDASVRQISIDLLGLIAAQLYKDALQEEDNRAWLAQFGVPEGEETSGDGHLVAQHLLLDFLADRQQQKDLALSATARSFLTCRLFADELTALRANAGDAKQQQSQLLARYRSTSQQLDNGCRSEMGAGDAATLAAALVQQGPLNVGRKTLLTWLIKSADTGKQVATTRAKAVKALGLVAETDPRLLASSIMQAGVNNALQDDAVSVREAAVDLLGKHISSKQDLALTYFDVLAKAVRDPGLSVRKRAVNIMWESCIKQPGFFRSTEACVHLLSRATDPEDSIQKLVTRVFHSLWFSPISGNGLSAQSRAQQVAAVAVAVYEAAGSGIHLPLEPSNPLLAILKQALDKEEGERSVGQALANALLESVLQAVDTETDSFPALIALHAFCQADVTLCMPAQDPASFARCLAPYLKICPADLALPKPEQRRAAERLLCILSVVSALMGRLDRLPAEAAQDLELDLVQLINAHHFVQVVSGAVHALCMLAGLSQSAGQRLAALLNMYMEQLKRRLPLLTASSTSPQRQTHTAHVARFLFIVGQLVRHGLSTLQSTAASGDATADTDQLLAVLLSFYNLPQGSLSARDSLRVKEKALEGLGLLFVAQPAALLQPGAIAAMQQALQPFSPIALKLKVLSNLLELLKSEEQGLKAKQEETAEAAQLADPVGRSAGEAGAGLVVPVQNGEGDSLNLSAGFIQNNWEAVKALALDTSPVQQSLPQSPSIDAQSAAQVRRRALEVMEAVLRGGVMPPFSAVSTLFALATDPSRDIADRALRVLRKEAEKYSEVRSRLGTVEGLQAAALFQRGLGHAASSEQSPPTAGQAPEVGQGLGNLYSHLLQSDRSLRLQFLRTLVRCFDSACDLLTAGPATANLGLLAFCARAAAGLPFKRCDEPYSLVHLINSTILRRGAFVLSAQKDSLGLDDATAPQAAFAAAAAADVQQQQGGGSADSAAAAAAADSAEGQEAAAAVAADSGERQQAGGEGGSSEGNQTAVPIGTAAQGGAMEHQAPAEAPGEQAGSSNLRRKPGSFKGQHVCSASLALTMLLMLKRFLKATYSMSEERITAFQPDIPDKRKQEERVPVTVQEGADLPLQHLKLDAPQQPTLWREQYKVFKHYMKTDIADYSEPTSLAKTTSRKRARRTNSMLEAAVLADADDDGNAMDAPTTNGATPAAHDDESPVTRPKAGKGQRSTARGKTFGGSSKSKGSTRGKPRKRLKVRKYEDSDEDEFDECGEAHDGDDIDFKVPNTSAAARKWLEPML